MQTRAVEDLPAGPGQDLPLVIAAVPINDRERRIALGVIISLSSVAVAAAPFANTPLAHIDAFIPVIQSVMCIVDLITASLLFVQYSIYPKRALLAVASGFVFSGLFAFIQTLAFPGAYSATGLFGDALNSANWLFVCWHTTLPLGVIVYALLKDAHEVAIPTVRSTTVTIVITLACVLVGTALLTWLATADAGNLPSMYLSTNNRQTIFSNSANVFLLALSSVAVVLLFVRRRTILDLWLIVVLLAWWPHFIVSIFVPVVRFSLGWYTARSLALVASSTLLCVLLAETAVLYRHLAHANVRLRR
jgi:Membrane-associated sensor, integral membrane domain